VVVAHGTAGKLHPMAGRDTPIMEKSERIRRAYSLVAFATAILLLLVGSCVQLLFVDSPQSSVAFVPMFWSAMLLRVSDRLSLPLQFVLERRRLELSVKQPGRPRLKLLSPIRGMSSHKHSTKIAVAPRVISERQAE